MMILKKMSKDKEISEDDERRMQEEIQKITDEFIIEIDNNRCKRKRFVFE